ncbi:MAG: M48 family metallopeptidase [Endomicrobium sp.]|jgi:STE24 endopeptidase|uniref:M48 family metallopeptidase n=1 Tax=Candidatus Endomicrobiellum cubanum TaxID=3242325 RepID=UPI002817F990|nr:M48 family metallopeptidase [Endomicrobium sp.]
MNIYTYIVLFFVGLVYLVQTISELLNVKNITTNIPKEFEDYFDKAKYEKSQKYLKTNTTFSLVSSSITLIIQIVFIVLGGFNYVNDFAVSFGFGNIVTGLIFANTLLLVSEIIKIPFSLYSVFVIEEKFDFNRMSLKTFISDWIKSQIITLSIFSIMFSLILWFFTNVPNLAWFYAFITAIIFQLFLTFIAPIAIMPLFNKYTPLENGQLKTSIEDYAKKENFKMKGLFKMDNSKRSNKSNAFFTGFGKYRRIVLFDTLIQKHTVEELTSILAHEMGHFKLGHIIKHMIFSFVSTGLMLYILSVFVNEAWLYKAFLLNSQPIYAGMVFFAFLYSPISLILSVISSYFSRKHEFEADAYAVTTYKHPADMTNALKKLSVDNLSNLYPHKFKVFLEYSHPPILERIKAINNISQKL